MGFATGSIVRVNTSEPYWHDLDERESKRYHSSYDALMKHPNALWKIIDMDRTGDAKVQLTTDDFVTDWVSMDCLEVASNVGVNDVDSLLREHAAKLDDAIAKGTMVPGLSSLGFIATLLSDYERIRKS